MVGLAVIVLLVLAFLWAGRLGDVGKGLGEGVRAFKQSMGGPEPPRKKKRKKKRDIEPAPSELDEADVVWERRRVRAKKPAPSEDDEN